MHVRYMAALALSVAALSACDTPTEFTEQRRADVVSGSESVLVGFQTHPGPAEIALIESYGGQVTRQFKYVRAVAATIPADQEAALRAAAGVRYVELNYGLTMFGGKQITDYGVSKIEAPAAWAAGFQGQNVKVGIFDSGIDLEHPDLVVSGGVDLIGDGRGVDDCNGHGTHVAGIVGARSNGRYTVGVAPKVQLYAMRTFDCTGGGGSLDDMIAGLEWAIDNGMDVINMSFGFGIAGVPLPLMDDPAGDEALTLAAQAGIVLVAASGNSYPVQGVSVNFPYVGWPAAHPDVIAVGATDDQDNISSFSQFGADQELTAPGVDNLSSFPVGTGVETSLYVPTDNNHELEAISMAYAPFTAKTGLTKQAVYAGGGTPVDFALINCLGKTAVIARGGLSFHRKAMNARDAGCSGVIIHNNQPGNFNGTLGMAVDSMGRPWLPVVSVSLDDGLYLRDQINAKPTTTSIFVLAGSLQLLSGTSMASPHVTGVAALVVGKNPAWSPTQVREQLRASSDDKGAPGWDPVYGYGRVNARRAVQ
jgi:serine protease